MKWWFNATGGTLQAHGQRIKAVFTMVVELEVPVRLSPGKIGFATVCPSASWLLGKGRESDWQRYIYLCGLRCGRRVASLQPTQQSSGVDSAVVSGIVVEAASTVFG